MKILWVNPGFLDYRVPVYKKLSDLTSEHFKIIYSKKRIPERVELKIKAALGGRAIGLEDERAFGKPAKGDFANTDIKIPFQPGLFGAIFRTKCEVIIAEGFFQWTPMALLAALVKRKRIIIAYERTAHTERNCPKWRTMYRQFISKFVNGFLVNGVLTKEYLVSLGIRKTKIFTGAMSGDSESLIKQKQALSNNNESSLKQQLNLLGGYTYLYVGQINERKGVAQLLEAWKTHALNHNTDNLLLVGTGPLLKQLKQEYADLRSITFTGAVDYDEISFYYSISDIFVMPTLEDNWSLVVPEAMASGLPIACSIYNGCYPELVHDGINGKLFDPLEAGSTINCLSYFHGQNLKLMGKESTAIETKYNTEAVANNIYECCLAVLNKHVRNKNEEIDAVRN